MATTILGKLRLGVLGHLHALLDTFVNTREGYEQVIRDVEVALAELRTADDESVGRSNGLRRDAAETESQMAVKRADIDLMLGDDNPDNDGAALQLQVELGDLEDRLEGLNELITDSDHTTKTIREAVDLLDAKHKEMVLGLQKLALREATTNAKNRASAAAEAALAAGSAAGSIDSIERRAEAAGDTADARFARVIGSMELAGTPEGEAKLARAQAALILRRDEIAKAAQ